MNQTSRQTIAALWDLETVRAETRFVRFLERIRSPRNALSTGFAIAFVGLYLLFGMTVLARRDVVDPIRLQAWLSGGMVCYAIFHSIKYAFASPKDNRKTGDPMSPALSLWIGGGPLPRYMVAFHEVVALIPATAIKTCLLSVVLFRDVPSITCLWIGVFAALFTLEWIRRLASLVIDALNCREKKLIRFAAGLVAIALVTQIGMLAWIRTPAGSDPAVYLGSTIGELAQYAMSEPVQWLAFALQPASHLAVLQPFEFATPIFPSGWLVVHGVILLFATFGSLASIMFAYAKLDQWSLERRHFNEQERLTTWGSANQSKLDRERQTNRSFRWSDIASMFLRFDPGVHAISMRQWHCVVRYKWNVLISFAIPMALSLSPLLTSDSDFAGQHAKQWIFVIGGIALSTLLLAPPALQIDFRRDLKRMSFLRSFPLSSLSMCAGMLVVPVAITMFFQWSTLAIALVISPLPQSQAIWLAGVLPSLALTTFALENALFLSFPHHVHDQGIAMVIRAKVTFLWKGLVLAIFPLLFYGLIALSAAFVPEPFGMSVVYLSSTFGFWMVALSSVAVCIWAWGRFDPTIDAPVE